MGMALLREFSRSIPVDDTIRPLAHLYQRPVRVGSVARCGHVNVREPRDEREAWEGVDHPRQCQECLRLRGAA